MGSAEILLFSGLILAGFSVYSFMTAILTNNTDSQILSWASGDEPAKSKFWLLEFCRPLVHQFTLQHARRVKSEKFRQKIDKKILTAGLAKELNVDEFIGLKILWGVMGPALFFVLNFALEFGLPPLAIVGFGVLGFFLPDFYANRERQMRAIAVLADLPFFIDLLALSTEAGLDFIGAIQRIVDKAEDSVLADEFSIVLRDIKLGSSRLEALRGMGKRLDVPEITGFVSVLVDADATGASIATVLKDQSEQMRTDRFVRAEKAGAKASQAILIPLMVFILPAVFIMVFGPVVLQFFYGGNV